MLKLKKKIRIADFFNGVQTKGSFIRNYFIMSGGAGLGMLLQIFFTPVLSRLYDPDIYGQLAIFNLLLDNFVMIAGLSFTEALVIPKRTREFYNLSKIIIYSTCLGLLIFISVLSVFNTEIFLGFFNIPSANWYWMLIPAAFLYMLSQIFTSWNIRLKNFTRNASSAFFSNLFSRLVALGGGFISPSAPVFIGSTVVGQLVSLPFIMNRRMLSLVVAAFKKTDFFVLKETFQSFKKYPLFIFPGSWMNRFSHSIPVWVLGMYFLPSKVGLYFFALNLLNLPLNIVANALRPVFFQKILEYRDNAGKLRQITKDIFYRLFFAGIPVLLVVIIFSDLLFGFIFGQEWTESGVIVSILATGVFFQLISSPISNLRRVLNKEREEFILQLFIFLARLTTFGYAFFDPDFMHIIVYYGIINAVIYIVNTLDIFRILHAGALKVLGIIAITLGIVGGISWVVKILFLQQ